MLRKIKEEKRQQELAEFNNTLQQAGANQAQSKTLAEELKELDANKQLPQSSGNPELDRRRMIYKNVRREISETEQAAKKRAYAEKMQAMEQRVAIKEQERRQQEASQAAQAAEAERLASQKTKQKKDFLSNLEAFNVE